MAKCCNCSLFKKQTAHSKSAYCTLYNTVKHVNTLLCPSFNKKSLPPGQLFNDQTSLDTQLNDYNNAQRLMQEYKNTFR